MKFIWEGTLVRMGQSMPIRETIVKENDDRFAATYFLRNDTDRDWQPVIYETCERQAEQRF